MAIKCPKCHSENPDTLKFCGECGTQLIPSSRDIQPEVTETLQTPIKELTTGYTFAGRYQVIEELGKGGMGKVYRVLDKKLNEEVALKLIKPEVASDKKTIERFSNELKLARKIGHRNVGRMFELMQDEGTHFITMEYITGEDLKSFIRRSRQLTVGTAIALAKQVCEGLTEAHRLGVVHRDLKPSNIMIDKEGNARIMDFGIARSLKGKGITGAGVMIGTPEYMSPEQVEGKEADQRSDIYSLGVILYEMVTGRVPFEGDTPLSIAMKQITEAPQDPRILNVQLPRDLSHVILKCMEKDRAKRYQSAEDVISELDKIEKGKTVAIKVAEWKNSIAVLPFKNMSADPEQEYFCEGIAEELINALAHIKGLRVVARTSAFALKGMNLDIREIGRMLNVKAVLEGSIRKAGSRLRVTAQLINVEDGFHLWSDRFDREMADIFAIQDEISAAIVDNLKVKLLAGEKMALQRRSTDDPEAYNLYLKGLYFVAKPSPESYGKALNFYRAAIDRDPNFALAHAGMAGVFAGLGVLNLAPPAEMLPKAKAALQKALSLNEDLAEAHAVSAALAFWFEWDWDAAGRSFDQVLSLNPGDAWSHGTRGWYLLNRRRFDEAIWEIKKALELDPLMPIYYAWSVGLHWSVGRPDEALQEFAKAVEIDPNLGLAYFHAGVAYHLKGLLDEALETFEKGKKLVVFPGWIEASLGLIYLRKGDREEAVRILEEMIENKKKIKSLSATCIAWLAGSLGKLDLAFDFLDKAYEERDTLMAFVHIYTEFFCPMMSADPRFKDILAKMKIDV